MSPEGPESFFMRSWRGRLTEDRLKAEHWLGYTPDLLRKRWCSPGHGGCHEQKLFDVPENTEEFQHVSAVFKAQPREQPAYLLSPPATWEIVKVLRVQRIENGALHEGCTKPFFASIQRSIEEQGIEFEP